MKVATREGVHPFYRRGSREDTATDARYDNVKLAEGPVYCPSCPKTEFPSYSCLVSLRAALLCMSSTF
jgi:hypothetical protein